MTHRPQPGPDRLSLANNGPIRQKLLSRPRSRWDALECLRARPIVIASREIGEARSIINKIVVDAHHSAADACYWHVVGRTSTGSAGMKSESFVAPDIMKRRCFARTYRNFVKIMMRP